MFAIFSISFDISTNFFAFLGSIVKLKSFALQIINVSPPNTVLTVISPNCCDLSLTSNKSTKDGRFSISTDFTQLFFTSAFIDIKPPGASRINSLKGSVD